MISELDYYIGWRLKHLKLERGKLPYMSHKEEIKKNMIRLINGRIKELELLREINRKNSLKDKGDYAKSKVIYLGKMRKFSEQFYKQKEI